MLKSMGLLRVHTMWATEQLFIEKLKIQSAENKQRPSERKADVNYVSPYTEVEINSASHPHSRPLLLLLLLQSIQLPAPHSRSGYHPAKAWLTSAGGRWSRQIIQAHEVVSAHHISPAGWSRDTTEWADVGGRAGHQERDLIPVLQWSDWSHHGKTYDPAKSEPHTDSTAFIEKQNCWVSTHTHTCARAVSKKGWETPTPVLHRWGSKIKIGASTTTRSEINVCVCIHICESVSQVWEKECTRS